MVREDSIQGVRLITPGVPIQVGRQFLINCTAAGNVSVNFTDGSTFIWPVAQGVTVYTWAVTGVNVSGTTATATYYNGQ
jgi:hypothetical protein